MLLLHALHLNCIENKKTSQSLLRDISQCCKEAPLPSKHCRGMECAVVQQASSEVHTSLKYLHAKWTL